MYIMHAQKPLIKFKFCNLIRKQKNFQYLIDAPPTPSISLFNCKLTKWCTPQMTPAAKNDLKSFTMFTSLKWSASMAGVVWEDRNGARTTDTKPEI
jgi:hypothetical protein